MALPIRIATRRASDRHPCKLSRAFGPRNPMKIASAPVNPSRLEWRDRSDIGELRPNVSLIRNVCDRANKWRVVSPLAERR
jgi:hypothetical protein